MGILFRSLLAYLLSLVNNSIFVYRIHKVNTSLSEFPKGPQSVHVVTFFSLKLRLRCFYSLLFVIPTLLLLIVCSGACKSYHGNVCSKFIPGDGKIFIALNNSQQQNEERILLAASILRDYTHSNCKDSLIKFLCFHLFPPCHSGKHLRPRYLCKDECDVLQAATCSREFRLLERRLGTSAHRTIPDCTSLSDRGNCVSIGK